MPAADDSAGAIPSDSDMISFSSLIQIRIISINAIVSHREDLDR